MEKIHIDEIVEFTGEGPDRSYKLAGGGYAVASEVEVVQVQPEVPGTRQIITIPYASSEAPHTFTNPKRNTWMDNLPA